MRSTLFLLIFFYWNLSFSQTYSKEIEEKIKLVENSLPNGLYQIEGVPNLTLLEKMAKNNVKGLSIAVINNYQIEWAKGYGWADEKEKRPVTTETMFEPGSISKSLNALGVMKLVKDKKVNLCCTDINDYLTSWKFPYDTSISKDKIIGISNLLSHTAGLSIHGFPGYYSGSKEFPTLPQILSGKPPANTGPVKSVFAPHLKFQYSGGGTTITQLIVCDVTKMPYDKYMKENVLDILGMTNSSYTQPPPISKKDQLATGYGADGKEIKGKYPILIEAAAGGLWTTPTDLCKFIIEMQLSYQGKSNKILPQEMTVKMMTPYIDSLSCLGVFVDKKIDPKYFTHGAGNQGFRGIYYGSLEGGHGLAIVINSDNGGIMNELVSSVAKVYGWKDLYQEVKPIVKKVIPTPASLLTDAPGLYRLDEYIIKIEKKGNDLSYIIGQGPMKMNFTSDSDFFNVESSSLKCFSFDAQRKINGYIWNNRGQIKKAYKIHDVFPADSVLQRYVGNYLEVDQPVSFHKKGNKLFLKWAGGDWETHFISDMEFYMTEQYGAVYKFYNENGNTGYVRKEGSDLRKAPKQK